MTGVPNMGDCGRGISLASMLSDLLYELDPGDPGLGKAVDDLAAEHGEEVYSELLFLLAHLRFNPPGAREHWRKILELRDLMESRLEDPVDVRVALVNYFVGVNRQLRIPKIIELQLFEATQASAYRDALTGLYNFRYFREHFDREIQRSRRYAACASLLMMDIDDFKLFNDRYGHATGNEALSRIAEATSGLLRSVDTVSRYGGEEFAIVLPATEKRVALVVADRIREALEGLRHEGTEPGETLTVSIGVASFPVDGRDTDVVLRAADSALYVAKSRGKNQVFLHGDDRRSHRRVEATLGGHYYLLSGDSRRLTTRNFSEGGLLIFAEEQLPVGSLIEVQLNPGSQEEPIVCAGRIVRVQEVDDGRFEVALRIVEIEPEHRHRLERRIADSDG